MSMVPTYNPALTGILNAVQNIYNQFNPGQAQFPGQIQTTMATTPSTAVLGGAAASTISGLRAVVVGIAQKASMAVKGIVGRSFSVAYLIRMAKRMVRFLGPLGTATALGITAAELAQLFTYDSLRKKRRTNYLNMRALNRAQRRMCGFQRTIERNYSIQRSMPKRRTRRKTCRK